jgi:putative redox protein
MKVNVKQVDQDFQFSSTNGAEKIFIGVNEEYQENTKGLRPMELLLSGLGACLSIDVLNLVRKKRIDIEDFNIDVEGVRDSEPPKAFKTIQIKVLCNGSVESKKLADIIKKVMNQYCSVFHSLDKNISIKVYLVLNDEQEQIL